MLAAGMDGSICRDTALNSAWGITFGVGNSALVNGLTMRFVSSASPRMPLAPAPRTLRKSPSSHGALGAVEDEIRGVGARAARRQPLALVIVGRTPVHARHEQGEVGVVAAVER